MLKQSGESERGGRVSLCGDGMMRGLLYEATQSMLTRVKKWSWLRAWAMTIARRAGLKKAVVALARRIAVIMHRMWIDGSEFRCRAKVQSRFDRDRIGERIHRW